MSARSVAHDHQAKAGWTDETLLDLLLDYIDNQQADDALDDFLAESRDNEETR